MRIQKLPSGDATIALDAAEISLMRLALERATFVDTPPDRQEAIFKFADDLLKGLGDGSKGA